MTADTGKFVAVNDRVYDINHRHLSGNISEDLILPITGEVLVGVSDFC